MLRPLIRILRLYAVLGLGVLTSREALAQRGPCGQLKSACINAGFVQGGVKSGTGLFQDCIEPIMQGTSQPRRASKPLPQVDPQIVAACKQQNPNFGNLQARSDQASESAASTP